MLDDGNDRGKFMFKKVNIPHFFGQVAVVAICLGILMRYRDFVPIWDTAWYWFLCIEPTLQKTLDIMSYNCSNHPNMAFFMPLGLLVRYSPFDPLTCHHIVGYGFATLAIVHFYQNARVILGSNGTPLISSLVTLGFAMNPVFLANIVNLTPEIGSVAYLLGFSWALLKDRFWLAALWGTGMIFTKEPLILVYGLYIMAYCGIKGSLLLGDRSEPVTTHLKALIRKLLPLTIPFFVLAYYVLVRVFYYDLPLFHGADSGDPRVMGGFRSLYSLNLTNPYLITVLIQVYVAGFMWIPTGFIVFCSLYFILSRLKKLELSRIRSVKVWLAQRPVAWQLVLLYLVSFYVFTRVVPVANPRYLLPMIPLTILLAVLGLKALRVSPSAMVFCLTLFIGVLVISQKRTADPLSRYLLGTFSFGDHKNLNMTSISKTCCGYGRDQLVYNLEFIELMRLQDKIFAKIKPSEETTIVYHSLAFFFITGYLNRDTNAREWASTGIMPRFIDHEALLKKEDIEEFYFIDMPNIDSQEVLREIQEKFVMEGAYEVEDQGYRLRYYRFKTSPL